MTSRGSAEVWKRGNKTSETENRADRIFGRLQQQYPAAGSTREPKIAEVVGDDEQDGAGNVGADAGEREFCQTDMLTLDVDLDVELRPASDVDGRHCSAYCTVSINSSPYSRMPDVRRPEEAERTSVSAERLCSGTGSVRSRKSSIFPFQGSQWRDALDAREGVVENDSRWYAAGVVPRGKFYTIQRTPLGRSSLSVPVPCGLKDSGSNTH
ncbi:hypothetical protein GGX14DRAFT_403137 [Mycena pura]|uniref:Uncharacterized protein n=1 Tax=Mycena pura TaxID=153505 RepID=A0AAD6V0U4_9AGAR|nr:hypothetical protein GGX14DRAFT_403137 [Mycena pura]